MTGPLRIPLARPEITEADRTAVLKVLSTPYLSLGPKLPEFENAISGYVGSQHAVAVNSGTSALQLGVIALDLCEGSEVIVPSFAFGAVVNVLLQAKLQPLFVDIDPRTFNPRSEAVEAAITARTKAILAIHTFGHPVAIDQYRQIADRYRLALIEDASEALGATWAGKQAGSFGDVGILAFYPNKQITTGEGGMLLTEDRRIADRVRRLRNQGRDPSLDWCQQVEPGYSYRLSEMSCALGVEQLRRIESIVQGRQGLAKLYDKHLAGMDGVIKPRLDAGNGRISWFCYVVQIGNDATSKYRDRISVQLREQGIETGRYFPPLHWQPMLTNSSAYFASFAGQSPATRGRWELPITERVAVRALALPFFNEMTEEEVVQVRDALAST